MHQKKSTWFACFFIGFVILNYNEGGLGNWLAPLTDITTRSALCFIELCGLDVVRNAGIISSPGVFAYEIYYRCTGILPITIFCALLFISEGSWHKKLIGMTLGSALILLINMVRLVLLFLTGVYWPESFSLMHDVVGEGLIVCSILGLFLLWKWRMAGSSGSLSQVILSGKTTRNLIFDRN